MNHKLKKWSVIVLSAALILTNTISVNAAGTAGKEERIYVNLNHDGSLENLYVVNAFEFEEETELLDYGKYKSVKNLTNDARLSSQKGEVTGVVPAGKFFYQGELEQTQLPWEIELDYKLDGRTVDAGELAGKTGTLELCIRIGKNTSAEQEFYEGFQLQVQITLDMENCSMLQAPGASVSNTGTKKQLSYLIMPGQEKEIRLTADVLDFSMEPVLFQGVPAALNLESDILSLEDLHKRTEELAEKADGFQEGALEIQGGTDSLWEGLDGISRSTGMLKEGLSDYADGTDLIKDGIGALYDGSLELLDGSGQLTSGMVTLRDGIHTLNSGFQGENGLVSGSGELAAGMKEMKAASQELTDGMNSLIGMQNQFGKAGREVLDAEADILIQRTLLEIRSMDLEEPVLEGSKEEQLNFLSGHLRKLILQVANSSVSDNGTVSDGNEPETVSGNEITDGTERDRTLDRLLELKSDVDQMLGNYETQKQMEETLQSEAAQEEIRELQRGVEEFNSGIGQLSDGISALAGGIAQMADGVGKLASGSNELVDGGYELTEGIGTFSEGINELGDGAGELKNSAQGLLDGAQQLADSSDDMAENIRDVADAAVELKEDSDSFKTDADDMDNSLDRELDKALKEFSAEEYEPISFVSEKNTNVRLVQFQMRTPGIEAHREPEIETAEEQPGFWKRLLGLFGIHI